MAVTYCPYTCRKCQGMGAKALADGAPPLLSALNYNISREIRRRVLLGLGLGLGSGLGLGLGLGLLSELNYNISREIRRRVLYSFALSPLCMCG